MSLTVVIPCYNEASRGRGPTSFVNRLLMLENQLASIDYRVILVDDGSADDSVKVFRDFVEAHHLEASWCCLESEVNQGKGTAVLRGILAADTDFVLMLDADMSVEPYRVVSLIHGVREDECFIGTRYATTSKIVNHRTLLRKFVSFCCITLVNMLFGLSVTDSQCGFKLLPTRYCQELTDYSIKSWLYDVEILYNLKSQGVVIREAPVRWDNLERESNVNALRAIIPSTKALFKLFSKKQSIKFHYKRR